jgi:hypothetical protein
MLTRLANTNGHAIQPEELGLLQRIFDDFSAAKGFEHDAVAATDTAAFLNCRLPERSDRRAGASSRWKPRISTFGKGLIGLESGCSDLYRRRR